MGVVWIWQSKIKNSRVNANLQISQIEKESKESSCSSSHLLVGRYWFIWCDGSHGTQTQSFWLWWMVRMREMLKDSFIWHHLLCRHLFHYIVTDNSYYVNTQPVNTGYVLRTTMCSFFLLVWGLSYRCKAKNLIFKIFGFGSRKNYYISLGSSRKKHILTTHKQKTQKKHNKKHKEKNNKSGTFILPCKNPIPFQGGWAEVYLLSASYQKAPGLHPG